MFKGVKYKNLILKELYAYILSLHAKLIWLYIIEIATLGISETGGHL